VATKQLQPVKLRLQQKMSISYFRKTGSGKCRILAAAVTTLMSAAKNV